MTSIWRTNRL